MADLVIYEANRAIAEVKRNNYMVTSPLTKQQCELKRDVDFGMIPKCKQPTLFKSGAEKIAMAYGLMQRYEIVDIDKSLDPNNTFFSYTVRCDLVKVAQNGQEYVFSNGYATANTREKRNGFNSAFDAQNSTLKMAQKRALVSAVIAVSGVSDIFTQDMENETFMNGAKELVEESKNGKATISAKQVQRIYAIAHNAGLSATQAQQKLKALGYASTKDITQEEYDKVCELFVKESTEN